MQQRIIRFVCDNSKIDKDSFESLMFNTDMMADDTGTVLIGAQTVECGLIDAVGGLSDAFAKLKSMMQ